MPKQTTEEPKAAGEAPKRPADEARVMAIGDIVWTKHNPRHINEGSEKFKSLVESVAARGVCVHVIVRPHPQHAGKFEGLDGERRFRAAKAAKRSEIPVILKCGLTDEEAFEITLIGNAEREDLTPLEDSASVAHLLVVYKQDVQLVASKLGRTPLWVRLRAGLQHLSPKWKRTIEKGESPVAGWGSGLLEVVARLPEESQDHVLERFGQRQEAVTLQQLKSWIGDKVFRELRSAPWSLDEVFKGLKRPACSKCANRSSAVRELFHEPDADVGAVLHQDRCLVRECWMSKQGAFLAMRIEAAKKDHPDLILVTGKHSDYHENERIGAALGVRANALNNLDWIADTTVSKTPTQGAVPAFVISGEGAGEIRWLRNSARSDGKKVKPAGRAPLAERKKALELRRWCLVLKVLESKADKAKWDQLLVDRKQLAREFLALTMAFGTMENRRFEDPGDGLDKIRALKPEQLAEEMWEEIKPVVTETLRHGGPQSGLRAEEISNARAIAALLGIDIEKLFEEAKLELPEPKSWAKEAAQARAAKKAKKTEKPKAAKKGDALKKPRAVKGDKPEGPVGSDGVEADPEDPENPVSEDVDNADRAGEE